VEQFGDVAMLVDIHQRIFMSCGTTIVAQEEVHVARLDAVAPDLLQPPDHLALLVQDHDDEARTGNRRVGSQAVVPHAQVPIAR
jgi:hypothetical protein